MPSRALRTVRPPPPRRPAGARRRSCRAGRRRPRRAPRAPASRPGCAHPGCRCSCPAHRSAGGCARRRRPRTPGPRPYRSTMRWLIRNTDDQRRLRAVVGSGASRSNTAWMWRSSGLRSPRNRARCRRRPNRPSQVRRHQHRHPVAPAARQRDAHQQVVGDAVGLVHRPHRVARAAATSPPRRRRACTAPRRRHPRRSTPGPCGRRCARRRHRPDIRAPHGAVTSLTASPSPRRRPGRTR